MQTQASPGSSISPDQRVAARFDTAMPVGLDGTQAQARNISETGIYFETADVQEVGSRVSMEIEYRLAGQLHRLVCEGEVVRVTRDGGRVGVAAKLLTPFFSPSDEDIEAEHHQA